MAAGATDEDVKKISQIIAQPVRQLETGNTPPEPGLAHSLPSEVVVSDDGCLGSAKMDIECQEAIKRSLSNANTQRKRLQARGRRVVTHSALDSTHRRGILSRAFQSW